MDGLGLQIDAIRGAEPAGYIEVRPLTPTGAAAPGRAFLPVISPQAVRTAVNGLSGANVFLGAAPRTHQSGDAAHVERVWTLWVDIDHPEALWRLARFDPCPALVVMSGSGGAHGYWPLGEPLKAAHAHRANRRLAMALGGDRPVTDPARVLRAVGSFNHKHDPPREVTAVHVDGRVFSAKEVVGGLEDDPRYTSAPRPAAPALTGAPIDGLVESVANAGEGNRNHALYWAACRLGEEGRADQASSLRLAAEANGLSSDEISNTIRSGLARGERER